MIINSLKDLGIEKPYNKVNDDNKWILTEEKLPPKGVWVLVSDEKDSQKPWEIMCYEGIETGTQWYYHGDEEIIEHYEYPAWTSGHGDIMSHNPTAWMPLPIPYSWKVDLKTGEVINT